MKDRWRKIPNKKWRLGAFLLVSAVLLLTYILYFGMSHVRNRTAADRFNAEVASQVDQLKDRFENYTDTLYSSRALFLTVNNVSRQQWDTFVTAQNVTQRYPGIRGIGYVKITSDGQAVLAYLAPSGTDQSHIGYDLYTSPIRKMILETARDTGLPRASQPLSLKIVPPDGSDSILIAMPVYARGAAVATTAERQTALEGYTVMALGLKPLLDSIFETPTSYGDPAVDISTAGKEIYSANAQNRGGLTTAVTADFGGQSWRLRFSAPSDYGLSRTGKFGPLAIMVGGLVITLVIAGMSHKLIKRKQSGRAPSG